MPITKQRNQIRKGKHGGMQLVLVEDVPHLGRQGELVEVKTGYGRNYLLPNSLAVIPTEHNLRLLERYKVRVQAAREARIADLKVLAEQVQRVTLTIEANSNAEGHLYGSVGPHEISKALRGRNLMIDAEHVILDELGGPIKVCGEFPVSLNLGFDIHTKVTVIVIPAAEKK
jgi:large subunit ribosomal protein L9